MRTVKKQVRYSLILWAPLPMKRFTSDLIPFKDCATVIIPRLSDSSTEMKLLFDWKFIKWERRLCFCTCICVISLTRDSSDIFILLFILKTSLVRFKVQTLFILLKSALEIMFVGDFHIIYSRHICTSFVMFWFLHVPKCDVFTYHTIGLAMLWWPYM